MSNQAKKIIINIFIIVLLFSFAMVLLYINRYKSEKLQTRTTTTDSFIKIDYIDSSGNLILASDKGYATVLKELDENGHSIYESYYDAQGTPVIASSGQYAITLEWSENQNTKVTYIDSSGQPIYNASGYVSRVQKYNEDGLKIKEFYLGLNDESVANTKGEFGRSFEYDSEGRKYKITSLDKNGEPVLNSSGYCYIIKSFNADNSVDTEMYYDTEGNPVKLSGGQYGVKHIGSQTVMLDANGNRIFSINEVFKHFPWLTVLLGTVLVGGIALLPQKWRIAGFVLYILFILYGTLITRETGGNIELTPFWSYKQFFSSYSLRLEILNNIWLFVPFGAGLYSLLHKRQTVKCDKESSKKNIKPWTIAIMTAMIFSIIIEASQYIFGLGLCEIDDVISNTLGAAIGVMMAASLLEIKESMHKRKNFSVINPNQMVQ